MCDSIQKNHAAGTARGTGGPAPDVEGAERVELPGKEKGVGAAGWQREVGPTRKRRPHEAGINGGF